MVGVHVVPLVQAVPAEMWQWARLPHQRRQHPWQSFGKAGAPTLERCRYCLAATGVAEPLERPVVQLSAQPSPQHIDRLPKGIRYAHEVVDAVLHLKHLKGGEANPLAPSAMQCCPAAPKVGPGKTCSPGMQSSGHYIQAWWLFLPQPCLGVAALPAEPDAAGRPCRGDLGVVGNHLGALVAACGSTAWGMQADIARC